MWVTRWLRMLYVGSAVCPQTSWADVSSSFRHTACPQHRIMRVARERRRHTASEPGHRALTKALNLGEVLAGLFLFH